MTATLCLHCGGIPASREEVGAVLLPRRTDTYEPMPHLDLMDMTHEVFRNVLGLELRQERFGIVQGGSRMFGVLEYDSQEMAADWSICVGVRNSYDKSMSAGIAVGASIFVCDNLCFNGDSATFLRRHTKNIREDLITMLQHSAGIAMEQHLQLDSDLQAFQEIGVNPNEGYALIGVARGNDILTPRQSSRALEYWDDPPYTEHQDRNLFGLYQAINHALKRSRPDTVMERHFLLHAMARKLKDLGIREFLRGA
jgi:hypothetical protein